jgi:uncharacterized membrane protein
VLFPEVGCTNTQPWTPGRSSECLLQQVKVEIYLIAKGRYNDNHLGTSFYHTIPTPYPTQDAFYSVPNPGHHFTIMPSTISPSTIDNRPAAMRGTKTSASPSTPNHAYASNLDPFRWRILVIPAFFTFAYAINFLLGAYHVGDPFVIQRVRHTIFGALHVAGGAMAMVTGPFQFFEGFRKRKPWIHRWLGRVYVAGVVLGATSGIPVFLRAGCYPAGRLGFLLLDLLWLATVLQGLSSIWHRDISSHRKWMSRNFALTYAAVMLRWQLPLLLFWDTDLKLAVTIVGFTSWIPNLLAMEFCLSP